MKGLHYTSIHQGILDQILVRDRPVVHHLADSFSKHICYCQLLNLGASVVVRNTVCELPMKKSLYWKRHADTILRNIVPEFQRLMFAPNADETIVSMSSSYPNPSFVGEYLPLSRDVNDKGFTATWKVLKINKKANTCFGVDFVEMASQYQQAMRSVKYGMLIICLVFVAGLLVEFVTRKQIHVMQYAVIGLSLALFYSLLIAFSDIVTFGMAYLTSAIMTTLALSLYFRGILRNKSAWILGGFVSLMYVVNYILLQMETYSLLAGSLLLFVLLCVLMYFTANMNKVE